jgi:ABC-type sugar transport system ATPase subunit
VSTADAPIVKAEDVEKYFGSILCLRRVSLEVQRCVVV